MNRNEIVGRIEESFRSEVQRDPKVKNATLLVNSDKLGIDVRFAEGKTGDMEANPQQPNHLASMGKLF